LACPTETGGRDALAVMWKTVSEDCNLACDYCYYSTCGGKPGPKINRIAPDVLEPVIRAYMQRTQGVASFAWQGGEPLLAGLPFFEEVVSLQARHAPPNTIISNAVQTNGTLINDRWARFFKTYNFLVGVSLDGPREVHDARRVDAGGNGTFDRVMKGIAHLDVAGVEYNILTVIHEGNVGRAGELVNFFANNRFAFIQFIPCMDFRSQQVDRPGVFTVTPEQYGAFLCEAFDHWYGDGPPKLSIRLFDNLLSLYAGREAEQCTHRAACPRTLILEQNGDAYPCDFYMHDDWKLGNAATDSLDRILAHPNYDRFLALKGDLPERCRSCQWQSLCHGGCPRNRSREEALPAPDYFCHSYLRLYAHAHERLQTLAAGVRRSLFDAHVSNVLKGKLPGRNDPCPCGSGKKFKQCCLNQ